MAKRAVGGIAEPRDWTVEYYTANETRCKSLLRDPNLVLQIPSINSALPGEARHARLVRFRGMIRDTRDPEYYLKKYSVRDNRTGESSTRSGMYVDAAVSQEGGEETLEPGDPDDEEISERQTYVVVSIPGLNHWAGEKTSSGRDEPPQKRERMFSEKSRYSEGSAPSRSDCDREICFVKIYDEGTSCKLNDIVDIVGFVSLDPTFEEDSHDAPTRPVARLHAIDVKVETRPLPGPSFSDVFARAASIGNDLRNLLGQLLFGDYLAAEYLLCHLLSSVYTRKDHLALGNFPINITNFPISKYPSFPKDLYRIIATLVPKSHYLELSLEKLNSASLVPEKDYESNGLKSGELQLSNNTHLVIDETGLTSGRVSALGRKNYGAVSSLVSSQRLAYDFKYFSLEYETDIPVLVLSEVGSFVPCAIRIPLRFDRSSEDSYERVLEAVDRYLDDEERLSDIRNYLEALRYADFEFHQDISLVIQEDFVKLRRTRPNFDADNLHCLMVLARLMSISRGNLSLSLDCWRQSIDTELERLDRISSQRPSS